MKLSKGKIFLIIIVVYFLGMGIKNFFIDKDINKQIATDVVIINDGKLDNSNEGKLVLINGEIKFDKSPIFLELDPSWIKSPLISRTVETYVKDEKGNIKKEEITNTTPVDDMYYNDYYRNLFSIKAASPITIGDYNFDYTKVLELLEVDNYYNKQDEIVGLTKKAHYYTNNLDSDNMKPGDYEITYRYYDIEKHSAISIIGKQVGDSIEVYNIDKKNSIFKSYNKKITTKEELKKELDATAKKDFTLRIVFILMIIGVGVFFIVDSKKNKKAE